MSRLVATLAVALGIGLSASACEGSPDPGPGPTRDATPALSGSWEPAPDAPFPGSLAGRVGVPASDEVVVSITLRNARFTAVPEACTPGTVRRPRSRIIEGNARLLCTLPQSDADRTIEFSAVAVGAAGDEMGGTIRNDADDSEMDLPALVIAEGPVGLSPRLRLLSSPDLWSPPLSTRSSDGADRRTLDAVLDDWESTDPDGVLIAGDRHPQYLDRLAQHHLKVYPADVDRAYAVRPLPDVQLITIDPVEIPQDRARLGLDSRQRTWLRRVLRRAQRDQVRWIIVQGRLPILGPVRVRGASGPYLSGGADSQAWRLFEKHGVDLYLSGGANDVTVLKNTGVTQITHGGPVALGLATALVLDFYADYVYVTLRDYDLREAPYNMGTGVIPATGGLQLGTGLLHPGR